MDCSSWRWPFCSSSNKHDRGRGDGDDPNMFGPLHDFTIVDYPELYPNYARFTPGVRKKKTSGFGMAPDSLLVPGGAVRPVLRPKRKLGAAAAAKDKPGTSDGVEGVRFDFDLGQEGKGRMEDEGTARVWEELENYVVAGAQGMPQPILTIDEQRQAQKRVIRLDRLQRKLSRKHKKEAKKRHCQKLCHLLYIMHQVIKNEYDAQKEAIVTRAEYFAQRRYSKKIPEHWDSDDDTMEHAITHVRISHPEWAEADKEGLKLRREDRLIRRMAPEQFWVWYRSRTFRTLLFCFVLYGVAVLFVYIVEREFGKLAEQVKVAKEKGYELRK